MSVRVLYTNTPTYIGGAEISLLTLMRHLDPQRYTPLLMTSGAGQLTEDALKYEIKTVVQGFPWFRKRYPWRYPASIIQMMNTIHQERVSLVHTNCDCSLRYAMHACQWSRIPYVSHVRDFVRTWFQPANVAALNRASAVIANSKAVAEACIHAGVESFRLNVIYNPVDVTLYQQAGDINPDELRRDLGLPDDAFVVGIVGQFHVVKGHSELVQAAPRILRAIPHAHFAVVGEAFTPDSKTVKEQLEHSIADADLTRYFHFLGYRHDLSRVMRSFDVLAVPSWTEPFGRVVVEGLAAGCSVVGTDVGGIPEIIEDGFNGLLIPPKDPDRLAEAIIGLAQNSTTRRRLAEAGLRSAQRFDVGQHVIQIQALYDTVA
jgi:glycosyltransferase involved in cell wall biosynthesis